MFLFYVLSFFKKVDIIQGGDIIQERTLIKEIRYSETILEVKFKQKIKEDRNEQINL